MSSEKMNLLLLSLLLLYQLVTTFIIVFIDLVHLCFMLAHLFVTQMFSVLITYLIPCKTIY